MLLDIAPPRWRSLLEVGICRRCHVLGSKQPVKVGDHLKTIRTDGRVPRGEKYIALGMQESAMLTYSRNPSSVSAY